MDSLEIQQVRLMKLDLIQHSGQVFAFSSAKIVEPPHLFTLRQQGPCDGRPDETSNAGNEANGHFTSSYKMVLTRTL